MLTRALAILLATIFVVPASGFAGATLIEDEPAYVSAYEPAGIVVPVVQGNARSGGGGAMPPLPPPIILPPGGGGAGAMPQLGITPEWLDAMAIDPQSWLLAEHLSYDAYTRNPVVDWDGAFGGTAQNVDDATEFRAAIVILEFPDRPFYQGRPAGSGMTGNPGFGPTAPNWDDPHDPARIEYVRNWVDSWLNVPGSPFVQTDWSTTEGNRGLTMDGYWMETSLGAITMTANTYGPFMAPVLESQLDAFFSFGAHWHGQFWHASRDYFFGAGWTLRNWFPAYSVALGAPDVTTLGPYTGGANVRGVAKRMAMESGVDFVDEHGNALYDVILIALAGYCQSPTWQEFGKMIFESHDMIAQQATVPHPNIPGEILRDPVTNNPRTGMDFTGWGRLNRIRETITAPGFDIIRDWPTFYMSDVDLNWRRHVSEGFNRGAFLLARDIAEEGLQAAYDAFLVNYPAASFEVRNAQGVVTINSFDGFRDRIFRPGFIRAHASRMEHTDDFCADETAVNAAVATVNSLVTALPHVVPVTIGASATAAEAQTARTNAVNAAISAMPGIDDLRAYYLNNYSVRSGVDNATTSPVVVEAQGVNVNTFPNWSIPFASGMVGRSATFNVYVDQNDIDLVATAINVVDANYPFSDSINLGGNDAARAAAITAYIRALPGFPAGLTVNVHGYISGAAVTLQAARAALAVTVESGFASGRTSMVRVEIPPAPPTPLAARFDMSVAEAPEAYDFNEFVYGETEVEDFIVNPSFIDSVAHTMMPAFVRFSAMESQERAAFMQTHGNSEWVRDQLLALVEDAMEFAENCEINPYFQAASTRYVPWTSWYGGVSFWSNASPGALMQGRWGHNVILPSAVQSESAGMAVYSHEVGHLILLPDQDNFPYQDATNNWTQRSIIGPWCTMARGSFTGPYGAHTRWQIPARHGAAVGTGLIARHRIAGGLTDLTVPRRENHWSNNPGEIMDPWNQVVRDDPENSLDVLYITYTDFRAGPPVVAEVFARNIPVNRGFEFGANDPRGNTGEIIGRNAIVIQGTEFRNQTPHRPSATVGSAASRWQGVLYDYELGTEGRRDLNGFRMIDTARWNYSIGGPAVGNISEEMLGAPGAEGNQQGFSIEVVQRSGYDSFAPDHGVVINRIQHLNSRSNLGARSMSAGGMSNPATFVIDANPGSSGLVSFWNADGSPWMLSDCNFMQMAASAFRAGVHNNPYMYRTEHPLLSTARWGADIEAALDPKWLPDDNRPGVWGATVNEWADVHNNFHFYILQRNNNAGQYGTFLSYDVAVRNTAPGAYVVGGGLELVAVGSPSAAAPGNFSLQRMALTHTGDATAADIIRIVIEGALAQPVVRTTPGGVEYMAHTRDQNVVILNNLFAIEPGETIEFDVFIRVPSDHTGNTFDTTGLLSVRANSETNPAKFAVAPTAVDEFALRAAIALIDAASPIAQLVVAGGAGATAQVRAAAIEAYLNNLSGMSALDVTISVESVGIAGDQWVISVARGDARGTTTVAVAVFTAPPTPPPPQTGGTGGGFAPPPTPPTTVVVDDPVPVADYEAVEQAVATTNERNEGTSVVVSNVTGAIEAAPPEDSEGLTLVTVQLPAGAARQATAMAILNDDMTFTAIPARFNADGSVTVIIDSEVTLVALRVESNFVDIDHLLQHVQDEINTAAARMIVQGVGNNRFDPTRSVLTSEAVTMFMRAMGMPADEDAAAVSGVNQEAWFAMYLNTAVANGLIGGNVNPTTPMTRIQAASLLANALEVFGMRPELTEAEVNEQLDAFTDLQGLTPSQREALAVTVYHGIFRGHVGGTMGPNEQLTRSQMASLAVRFQNLILEA